nr:MAG TPA: hypothetical protein [Caudoviricetes sp.]
MEYQINKVYRDYEEFKREVDSCIMATAEGFVKIGYLLKVARDTDILKNSGYETMTEFAKSEYGIDASQTSRFIAINDKYSENGYGPSLDMKYKGFGVSKLSEMLSLPDVVTESLTADVTRQEIRDLKIEVKEEEKKSDLETYMERPNASAFSENEILADFMKIYLHPFPLTFSKLVENLEIADKPEDKNNVIDILAPSGHVTLMTRVEGIARLMIVISGEDEDVKMVNIRTQEKHIFSWDEFISGIKEALRLKSSYTQYSSVEERWQQIYIEEMPSIAKSVMEDKDKSIKIAPAQMKKSKEQKKDDKKDKKSEEVPSVNNKIDLPEEIKAEDKEDTAAAVLSDRENDIANAMTNDMEVISPNDMAADVIETDFVDSSGNNTISSSDNVNTLSDNINTLSDNTEVVMENTTAAGTSDDPEIKVVSSSSENAEIISIQRNLIHRIEAARARAEEKDYISAKEELKRSFELIEQIIGLE